MSGTSTTRVHDDRITYEIVVDAYGAGQWGPSWKLCNGDIFRVGLLLTILGGLLSLPGCASMAAKKAVKQYEERFSAEVGKKTLDDYIKVWGPPVSRSLISDGEVCKWRFSYGSRVYVSEYGHGHAYERYDEFILTFDEDAVLKEYRLQVHR